MYNLKAYMDSLQVLRESEWTKLSMEQKVAAMQAIENENAHREGRAACKVSQFTQAPDEKGRITCGSYNWETKDIKMNTYHLSERNPEGCLNTVLHEGRHAYQHCAVKGEIEHHPASEVKAWENNRRNYINGEKNIRAYYRQPLEADAHEKADIGTRQILAEQKIQDRSNKGIQSFKEKTSRDAVSSKADSTVNKGIQSYQDKVNGANPESNTPSGNSEAAGQTSGSGQER